MESRHPADGTGPLVLFYTPFFGQPPRATFDCDCPARWTTDRAQLPQADIVIFHVPDCRRVRWIRKYPRQIWVAWSMESAENYPQLRNPGYMRRFDLRMTYERDADVWTSYLPRRDAWRAMQDARPAIKTEAAPLVMFQSADANRSRRMQLATELSRHIAIDSYGRFLRNREMTAPDLGRSSKLDTISRYRFCLTCENAIERDYVTEKIFDALAAGTVPVYLGAPNVADFVPEGCYVDAAAYRSAEELADHLRFLIDNPDEYARYHTWRSRPLPKRLLSWVDETETEAFCRLLTVHERRRHDVMATKARAPGVGRHIVEWVLETLRSLGRTRRR